MPNFELTKLLSGSAISDYFTPLPDKEANQKTIRKWRKIAADWDYKGTIAWQVKAGFTLKGAGKFGDCYQNFNYLQDWIFEDKPTKDCLVYWIPKVVPNSVNKNFEKQTLLVKMLGKNNKLDLEIGEAGLLAGLILAHFKIKKKKVPVIYIRSNICNAAGFRLSLGYFGVLGLPCGRWFFDEERYVCLGVFALGVESLRSLKRI